MALYAPPAKTGAPTQSVARHFKFHPPAGRISLLVSSSALENASQKFHLTMDERSNGRETDAYLADSGLVWIGAPGDLLAAELDTARIADGLPFFPALAGLHPFRGQRR